MKKFVLPVILCLFIFAGQAWAAPLANFTVQTPGFSASDKFYIDIYGVSIEDDFELGDCDLRIQFNNAALSNPVLSLQNSAFHSNSLYDLMDVASVSGNVIQLLITATGATGTTLPGTETRLARITFDIDDGTASSGIVPIGFGTSTVATADGTSVLFNFTGPHNVSLDCLPSISGTPATSVAAGNAYSFTPTASGGCDPVTYDIQNQPSWASFSTSTGQLSGTPTGSDAGTYSNIIITVADPDGDEADLTAFNIEVTSSCSPPTISGPPDNFVKVGDSYSFTPTVSNGCTPLVFSGTNIPTWAVLATNTGVLTGSPLSAHVGSYSNIDITVTDNSSNPDSLGAFDIEVCEATAISGTPSTSVAAGQAYSFTPSYSGCGDPTFDIENQPAWASFDVDTGILSGAPGANYVGTYEDIVIKVTDETDDEATLTPFNIEVTAASGGGGGSSGGGGCFISTVWP